MAAETQLTANTGLATVSTANTNLDGVTGNYTTIITGALNGTIVRTLKIKATTNTSQGMVRFFVTDGGGTRLLTEIMVRAVTKSATDRAFEKTIYLNYKLESGDIIKYTTEIANTFNVIAEGADWTYFSAYVRPDSINYTANTGSGLISAANSNLDGTGTLVTILTAGSSSTYKGCLIKSVSIKAIVNTTHGMVRLFIQDTGSTTRLFTEIKVPYVTKSATARSFSRRIVFPRGFMLQAGYKILASTENAESFQVVIEGMDWNYPSASLSNYTSASGTNTTSEELLHSLQVPANYVYSGNLLNLYANIATNNNANNKTFRVYVNTTNTLTAATLIGTLVTNSVTGDHISRFIPIISDTSVECYGGTATNLRNQYSNTTGTSAAVTVPSVSAGFWILISGQKAVGTDTDTVRWSMVTKVF